MSYVKSYTKILVCFPVMFLKEIFFKLLIQRNVELFLKMAILFEIFEKF